MHFREELSSKAPGVWTQEVGIRLSFHVDYIAIFFRIILSPGKACPTICESKSVMPDLQKKGKKMENYGN